MLTPLYDAVTAYCKQGFSRLHMPGHKGRAAGPLAEIYPMDITEVEGADSLFHPMGALAALEDELASIYGARRTLLSAGGATLCIQTMLALACGIGGGVVMGRGIHRSAVNACALLDLSPVWVWPRTDGGEWFTGRYASEDIAAALDQNPDIKTVYITSPDYFGVVSDLAKIAAVCRERDAFLLVDNAHGAHLPFLPSKYGLSHPMACGASACADSLHKTMPAMTGGALLHLMDERLCAASKEMMSLFGSTSPSYPIMLSCEQAGVYAQTRAKEDFAWVVQRLDQLRDLVREKGGALPLGRADPAKLSFSFAPLGINADDFRQLLRKNGIEPEYMSATACVLMANGFNSEADFMRIEHAVHQLPQNVVKIKPKDMCFPRCKSVMRVRQAVFAPRTKVEISKAEGLIAALEASPCPPGIPLVMSGEKISAQAVDALLAFGLQEVWVIEPSFSASND